MNSRRNPENSSNRKACLWIAGGCGCVVLAGILVIGGFSFWAVKAAKDFEATMRDPDARQAQALDVLGSDQLPEGYRAELGMSIPFFADIVILTDDPLPADSEDGLTDDQVEASLERTLEEDPFGTFIFVRYKQLMEMMSGGEDLRKMRDFFEGRSDNLSSLRDAGVDVDIDDVILRDRLSLDTGDVLYVVGTGRTDSRDGRVDSLVTVMLFECSGEKVPPMGIWVGEMPEAAVPGEEAPDYSGTIADPANILSFIEPLQICT